MRGTCSGAGEDSGRPGPHRWTQVRHGTDNLGRGKGGLAMGRRLYRRCGGMSSGESEPELWLGRFLRPEELEWTSPLASVCSPGSAGLPIHRPCLWPDFQPSVL